MSECLETESFNRLDHRLINNQIDQWLLEQKYCMYSRKIMSTVEKYS